MRRPDGKMSKKDRRAIQAFGLKPSEDQRTMADLLSQITPNPGPTFLWTFDSQPKNGNAWIDLRTQQVTFANSATIRISFDPTPPPGN